MIDNKKRVLLVDDQTKIVYYVQLGLNLEGFDVATANSGNKALEAIRSETFDIMLLDIRLPDIDGFSVLQKLRKFSQIPVIAYSATPEYSARALEYGANGFIAKPFEMDQLIETIYELTKNDEEEARS